MSEQNVDILRPVYSEWSNGNLRAGPELFDESFVLRTFEAFEGEEFAFHGMEGVEDFMRRFVQQWDDLRFEPTEFVATGDKVMVGIHQTARGKRSGANVEMDLFHVWTFRGQRATELRVVRRREEAVEAAGLSG
jgi:ketosteroid isomerase-like protein